MTTMQVDSFGRVLHAGISIETQDGVLDLADVTWQAVAPCGCISGVSLAASGDDVSEWAITAKQAAMNFCESKAEMKRDAERGFTYRPRLRASAAEEMKLPGGMDCPHTPKWGYEKRPDLPGYQWAATTEKRGLIHLIPEAFVQTRENRDYGKPPIAPVCKGQGSYHWTSEWFGTSGKVECKKCEAIAISGRLPID